MAVCLVDIDIGAIFDVIAYGVSGLMRVGVPAAGALMNIVDAVTTTRNAGAAYQAGYDPEVKAERDTDFEAKFTDSAAFEMREQLKQQPRFQQPNNTLNVLPTVEQTAQLDQQAEEAYFQRNGIDESEIGLELDGPDPEVRAGLDASEVEVNLDDSDPDAEQEFSNDDVEQINSQQFTAPSPKVEKKEEFIVDPKFAAMFDRVIDAKPEKPKNAEPAQVAVEKKADFVPDPKFAALFDRTNDAKPEKPKNAEPAQVAVEKKADFVPDPKFAALFDRMNDAKPEKPKKTEPAQSAADQDFPVQSPNRTPSKDDVHLDNVSLKQINIEMSLGDGEAALSHRYDEPEPVAQTMAAQAPEQQSTLTATPRPDDDGMGPIKIMDTPDNIQKMITALNKYTPDSHWEASPEGVISNAKTGASFEVQGEAMVSKNDSVQTFEAMLVSFKATNADDRIPTITTTPELRTRWEDAAKNAGIQIQFKDPKVSLVEAAAATTTAVAAAAKLDTPSNDNVTTRMTNH
jgi:hypothetical protein